MGLEVYKFIWNYLDSNMYIIKRKRKALVIDPVDLAEAYAFLDNTDEVTVLLTHEHFDHVCGLNRMREEHKCIVIAQEYCSERIQDSKKNLSAYAEAMAELSGKTVQKEIVPFICEGADIVFQSQYEFEWEGTSVLLIATPGHSPGSACILFEKKLFVGDSLLERGPMYRYPGGNVNVYVEKTIPIIKELIEKSDIIYQGHGSERISGFEYFRI